MGVHPKKILLSAAKCKLVEESKEDNSKLKTNGGSSLFASCSFEDLGLHPTLCQHLQGPFFFLLSNFSSSEYDGIYDFKIWILQIRWVSKAQQQYKLRLSLLPCPVVICILGVVVGFDFQIFLFIYHFYFIDIVFWKLPLWFLSFIILLFLYDFYEYLGFYVEAFKSLVFCAGIIPWQLFVTLCYLLTKLLLL